MAKGTGNPRYKNGNARRKARARFRAMGAECGICRGKFGPIHYDEPSDAMHPWSFVIDEIKPISKFEQYGYMSKAAAAQDISNLQAAHYWCNQQKGANVGPVRVNAPKTIATRKCVPDGDW